MLADALIGTGYSGAGKGLNNRDLEWLADVGPIPRGAYRIELLDGDHGNLKAPVFKLVPIGHSACGRDGFLLHGDSTTHTASHGCVVPFLRSVRLAILAWFQAADSQERVLVVT